MMGVSELMANTHPDKDVRDEAEACMQRAAKELTAIQMDPDLYASVNAVDKTTLDGKAKRFVDKTIEAYKLSGVDKDEATRKVLADLDAAIVQSGQDFDKNIRNDRKTIQFTAEQLAGLPEDFMKSHQPDADGKITVSTDNTDYFPVLNYAKDENTRRAITELFNSRAYPANDVVFKKLLNERYQYATTLGFENWAAYNAYDKMAKDTKTIASFIEEIAKLTEPRAKAEIEELMALKRADNPDADGFYAWDRFYYTEALKRQKYDVDAQSVRQYFAYEKVKRGILSVASRIYGVTFQQSDRPVWHPSVEAS